MNITLEKFAAKLKVPIQDLLTQFRQAGIFGLSRNDKLSKENFTKFFEFKGRVRNGQHEVQHPDAELESILVSLHADRMPVCEHCGESVRRDRLARHIRRVHKAPVDNRPLGKMVLEGIANGVRWEAASVERCNSCRSHVVFLDVGAGVNKAFDIDESKKILGTHACDVVSRSESVRAVSGGAIDSNRRRH